MCQDLLLDLARIDVGAAGDVHVRGPAGDVEEAFLVHVAEIAGAEPAVAECFRVGVRVVVVAGEHGRTADADLARLTSGQLAAAVVLDRDLHPGALIAAGADLRPGSILGFVERGRKHGDVAGDLAEPEVLDQHLSEFLQRVLLVLPVHRGAGIDHVAQGRVIVRVDRWMLGQHLHDGRHGEHVRDPPLLDQPPGLVGVEPVAREQHGLDPARHLHELMDAGSVRERRQDQGGVPVGGARHQVAEVVRDHEGHLAVRQHRGLGTARRARREEEPAWIVVLDGRDRYAAARIAADEGIVILAELRSSDRNRRAGCRGPPRVRP